MKISLLAAACFLSVFATAAPADSIVIAGTARDAESPSAVLNELMIVNLETQHGFFGKSDGTFLVSMTRTDTLVVGATGYAAQKICFADSAKRDTFRLFVRLRHLSVTLKEVRIFSPRDLEEIQKDIQKLGYNKHDYELSGVDAFYSPITFLYQQFNRLERLKRHNLERINEDRKRELLKELFHRYVAWDIIDLDDSEFDHFVDFCNVPEEYMKTATQYDFIEYIKGRYQVFESLNR